MKKEKENKFQKPIIASAKRIKIKYQPLEINYRITLSTGKT